MFILVFGGGGLKDFSKNHKLFFGSVGVCSKIVGFVPCRNFCSVFADLKFKCLACLPGINFYRDI